MKAKMILRDYQIEAVEAAGRHVCKHKTNPVIVAPTGSGKSLGAREKATADGFRFFVKDPNRWWDHEDLFGVRCHHDNGRWH